MKKYLLLILVLLVPFMVKAEDIEIKEIKFVEKTDSTQIIEEASFEGKQINFNVRFHAFNDYVKYKVTLKNNTDKDYNVNSNKKITEYVSAYFEGMNEKDILEANGTKTIYFIVKYDKEIPLEVFAANNSITTEEAKTIELSVRDNNISIDEKNPKTNDIFIVVLAIVLVASSIIVLVLVKNKKAFLVPIVLLIAIPLTVYALDEISININSKIEIKHPYFTTLDGYGNRGSYFFDWGMTWEEFLNSDYNVDNWEETLYAGAFNSVVNGEQQTNYYELESGKKGIKTREVLYGCWQQNTILSHDLIATIYEPGYTKYAYTDETIINEHEYTIAGQSC